MIFSLSIQMIVWCLIKWLSMRISDSQLLKAKAIDHMIGLYGWWRIAWTIDCMDGLYWVFGYCGTLKISYCYFLCRSGTLHCHKTNFWWGVKVFFGLFSWRMCFYPPQNGLRSRILIYVPISLKMHYVYFTPNTGLLHHIPVLLSTVNNQTDDNSLLCCCQIPINPLFLHLTGVLGTFSRNRKNTISTTSRTTMVDRKVH